MIESAGFYLMLAAAGALGWAIGRQRGTRKSGERVSQLSRVYFRGLNYLLNEQQDKAIELFLEIAEVDADTVETQLALGTLFRRRGEVERAIRLHQGLVTRPGLSEEHRSQAVLELGEDYMRAGLLDRAETLFTDVLRVDPGSRGALRHLVSIYQSEREWDKALACAERLRVLGADSVAVVIAHLQCELAERAAQTGDDAGFHRHLDAASAADPDCVRVPLLRAARARANGDCRSAAGYYERVVACDRLFVSEVVEPLLDCYQRLGELQRAEHFFEHMLDSTPPVAVVLGKSGWLRRHQGPEAALAFLSDGLRRWPSIRGLSALLAMIENTPGSDARVALAAVTAVTTRLLERAQPYRCERCGFGAKALHWQCPSCKSWGSMRPISLLVGL